MLTTQSPKKLDMLPDIRYKHSRLPVEIAGLGLPADLE